MMQLGELLKGIEVEETFGPVDCEITGIAYDSRRVGPGNLFVALKGEITDGNLYVNHALARGAAAVLSEEPPKASGVAWIKVKNARRSLARLAHNFYHRPSERVRLVGVTGTNGKTTTTYLLESMLRRAGETPCVVGTISSRIGDESLQLERTTPEAPDLAAILDRAAGRGCRYAVMEVSSHALDRLRVYGFSFRTAIFTNLTRDHLDYHRDFESYYAAKRRLFLPEGVPPPPTAVINADDQWGRRLASEARSRILTYGLGANAEIRAERLEFDFSGTRMTVNLGGRKLDLTSRLVGRANAYNILAAAAAAFDLGFDPEIIRLGIADLAAVPGRFEKIDCGQPFLVIVDYAHTDDALRNLLEIVRALKPRRVITLFGCGGDRDRTKRPLMGEVAGRMSDLVVATSDNPRSEDPEAILDEIEVGLKRASANYVRIADRREAIAYALGAAGAGDAVVIAGKGHEKVQVLKDKVIPFDDAQVACELLKPNPQPSAISEENKSFC